MGRNSIANRRRRCQRSTLRDLSGRNLALVRTRLATIITKVNDLFEGDLTEDDRLVYVNNVIKGKLLESMILVQQAANNTKEQFAELA